MSESIEGRSRELLESPNICHVATIRKDGTPYVVPTWVDVEGDRVVLNTADGRLWPKNLRRDPRVTLTVSPTDNPYEYLTIRGRVAEESKDGAEEHIDKIGPEVPRTGHLPLPAAGGGAGDVQDRAAGRAPPGAVTASS